MAVRLGVVWPCALLLAGALIGSAATAQVSEADSIRSRAGAVLRAYRARDVDALVAFVPPAQLAQARASLVVGSSRYESIFGESSWRWRAVREWNGVLGEVRVQGTQARVRFAALPDGEVAVVTLRKIDQIWYFDDVHSPSSSDFAAWGQRVE